MGVLVRNVSIVPVTGSFTTLRSDGNLLPIYEYAGDTNMMEHAASINSEWVFIFIK